MMAIATQPETAAEQKARYEEKGYITFPTMLDRSEVAVLRSALDELSGRPLRSGDPLGPYDIVEPLGAGGMG